MTILVAINTSEGVHYGSDSRITLNGLKLNGMQSKWKPFGDFYIGSAGYGRLEFLLRAAGDKVKRCKDVLELCTLMDEMITADGWLSDTEDGPVLHNVNALVIHRGQLFYVDSSITPFKVPPGEVICAGSGAPYAYGALHATRRKGPAERVKAALEAAIALDTACGAPLEQGVSYV